MIKSKKAGEKYFTIWWVFVVVLVTVGVVVAVLANAAAEINVKKIESKILIDKSLNCLIQNSQLNSSFLHENFDFYENCRLDENNIRSNFFIDIEVYNFDSCLKEKDKLKCINYTKNARFGDLSIKKTCEILQAGTIKAKNPPGCIEKYVYTLNQTNQLIIHIYAGSSNTGART